MWGNNLFSLTGSPISTPSHSPLPRTQTTSTPVHSKQSSSSLPNNPYIIVDKPGQVVGMASSSTVLSGTDLLLVDAISVTEYISIILSTC